MGPEKECQDNITRLKGVLYVRAEHEYHEVFLYGHAKISFVE